MADKIKEKDPIKKATKPRNTAATEKAKTPAKPRKTLAKKIKTAAAVAAEPVVIAEAEIVAEVAKAPEPARFRMPSREEIEHLARQYWAQRGYQDGYAEQDWLRAEQELLKKAS